MNPIILFLSLIFLQITKITQILYLKKVKINKKKISNKIKF